MPGQVAEDVKTERLARLQALLESQQQAFNTAQTGKVLPVLFEKSGRNTGQLIGRSPYLQSVHVEAPDRLLGQIVQVEIKSAARNSLAGARVLEPA
jgi:tRNA-2-methylthio-N6-dimethylallyladenosine synthase